MQKIMISLFVFLISMTSSAQKVEDQFKKLNGKVKMITQEVFEIKKDQKRIRSYKEIEFKSSKPIRSAKYKTKKKEKMVVREVYKYKGEQLFSYHKFNSKNKISQIIKYIYKNKILLEKDITSLMLYKNHNVKMSYDKEGQLIKKYDTYLDKGKVTKSHTEIKYSLKGKKRERISYDQNHKVIVHVIESLNNKKQVIIKKVKYPETSYLNNDFSYKYNEHGSIIFTKVKTEIIHYQDYTYDKKKNWIKRITLASNRPNEKTVTKRKIIYNN